MKNNKYKVAGYLRLSVEDGNKDVSNSIVSQKNIILDKIKTLGNDFELFDFYVDDGYTGLNTDRPNFQRMLIDVERKKVNCIITKDLSRLSRNNFEANYYIEIYFLEKEIRYISVLDNIDTFERNTNNDIIQFKTLINDWYSKDISRKVKSGVWARKEQGLYVAAKAPYGYVKDDKNKNKLIINNEEAEVVKKIFNMYNLGFTIGEIVSKLKENKIYCPSYKSFQKNINGKYGWTYSTVSKILKNKAYLGHIEYGKCMNLSYKSKKVKQIPRNEWKIYKNAHKPIISQELFESVQKKIELNQKAKSHVHIWLLNGIVHCKECGNLMQLKVKYRKDGKSISFKRLYCSSSINKKESCKRKYKGIDLYDVTQIVTDNLNKKIKYLVKEEDVKMAIEEKYIKINIENYQKIIKIQEKELEKSNKIILELYKDYKAGIIAEEDFKFMYNQELENKNRINKKIEETDNNISKEKIFSDIDIIKKINKIEDSKNWNKNQIADIIDSVEIDNQDNIYIKYRYEMRNV